LLSITIEYGYKSSSVEYNNLPLSSNRLLDQQPWTTEVAGTGLTNWLRVARKKSLEKKKNADGRFYTVKNLGLGILLNCVHSLGLGGKNYKTTKPGSIDLSPLYIGEEQKTVHY
jgi:hypothetical protein